MVFPEGASELDRRTIMTIGKQEVDSFFQHIQTYQTTTDQTLRFIPTEGRMSPLQKSVYQYIHHERYLHAPSENNEKAIRYPDIEQLQIIHSICRNLINHHLGTAYANPDFLSGMQAMQACILTYSQPQDLVLSIAPEHGGHESTTAMLRQLQRNYCYLPFDVNHHIIDTKSLNRSLKPTLIYLDHSNILYPHDLNAIKAIYPRATLVVDISQIMALVMGKTFPNPIQCGADVLVGSTHKSLNGPQKAVLATNNASLFTQMQQVCNMLISNNHPADVAALAVALIEFKTFGKQYALDLVQNANCLARALHFLGICVYDCASLLKKNIWTQTQHVWIDCDAMGWVAEDAVKVLAKAGIIVNTLFLAKGGKQHNGVRGLRLGTTEVTRLGMGPEQMELAARIIADLLLHKISILKAKARVRMLRKRFSYPLYCFH